MRFRAKFGALGWFWVGLICLWIAAAVFKHYRSTSGIHGSIAVLGILPVLFLVLNLMFTYWELDSSCLRVHRLWHKKEIAWEDVTHVGGFNGRPSASMLEVD
jgi:hypothetical protein